MVRAALVSQRPPAFHSIAGQISSVQPRLIEEAIERMLEGAEVVAALDNDETSGRLVGRSRLRRRFQGELPPPAKVLEGKDWRAILTNDNRPKIFRMRSAMY
jgi:hypothetical protein